MTVLPITHTPPRDPEAALEIPLQTKRRIGLDAERSWVALDEANQFYWPGPDLSPAKPGNPASIAFGILPSQFVAELRLGYVKFLRRKRANLVVRDE